jgi:hypothetical protein
MQGIFSDSSEVCATEMLNNRSVNKIIWKDFMICIFYILMTTNGGGYGGADLVEALYIIHIVIARF